MEADFFFKKVDTLFAEFIRLLGAAGGAGTGSRVPRVPLNINPFNAGLGNNNNVRIPLQPNIQTQH